MTAPPVPAGARARDAPRPLELLTYLPRTQLPEGEEMKPGPRKDDKTNTVATIALRRAGLRCPLCSRESAAAAACAS
jgi:hypothetical protein